MAQQSPLIDRAVPVRSPRAGGHWPVRIGLVAGGLAVCGMWWFDPVSGTLSSPGDLLTGAGRVAGLVGAYLVLVQLLLLARVPWLERAIGFDRLVAWHRGLGTNVVLVLITHVSLVVAGVAMSERNAPWSAAWEVLTTYPDTPYALIGLIIFGAVAISGARFARRRLSYEGWYLLHLGTYLAVALAFLHQISSGADFVTNPGARALWVVLYLGVAGAVLWWRVARPVRGWFRHAITVDRVIRETPETVSVWLRGRDLAALGARPGQFLLWRFVTVGHRWTAHPYSLSAPIRGSHMRITVKAGGDHSAALARLRPGVPVVVEGPFGRFTADARRRQPVLLISGGSGIAPIRALAEELLRERADVVLVHRASDWRDVPLRAELDALAEHGLRVHYLIGRRAELRYDPLAPERLHGLVPDVSRRSVYLCGPAGMTERVLGSLRRLGVPDPHIHIEEFDLR